MIFLILSIFTIFATFCKFSHGNLTSGDTLEDNLAGFLEKYYEIAPSENDQIVKVKIIDGDGTMTSSVDTGDIIIFQISEAASSFGADVLSADWVTVRCLTSNEDPLYDSVISGYNDGSTSRKTSYEYTLDGDSSDPLTVSYKFLVFGYLCDDLSNCQFSISVSNAPSDSGSSDEDDDSDDSGEETSLEAPGIGMTLAVIGAIIFVQGCYTCCCYCFCVFSCFFLIVFYRGGANEAFQTMMRRQRTKKLEKQRIKKERENEGKQKERRKKVEKIKEEEPLELMTEKMTEKYSELGPTVLLFLEEYDMFVSQGRLRELCRWYERVLMYDCEVMTDEDFCLQEIDAAFKVYMRKWRGYRTRGVATADGVRFLEVFDRKTLRKIEIIDIPEQITVPDSYFVKNEEDIEEEEEIQKSEEEGEKEFDFFEEEDDDDEEEGEIYLGDYDDEEGEGSEIDDDDVVVSPIADTVTSYRERWKQREVLFVKKRKNEEEEDEDEDDEEEEEWDE